MKKYLLVAAAMVAAASAQAALASVTGEGIYNFDLSGRSPAAPYQSITPSFALSSWRMDSGMEFTMYGGLDGTGGFVGNWQWFSINVDNTRPIFLDATVLDGMFSIGVRRVGLQMPNLSGVSVTASGSGGATLFAEGVPSAVPVPAAAWLLISGFGALGAAARRSRVN